MQRRPFKDGQENKHKESLFERKEAREFPSAIDNNMIEDPKKKHTRRKKRKNASIIVQFLLPKSTVQRLKPKTRS